MDRRDFLKNIAAAGAAGFVFSKKNIDIHIGAKRPNILLILADDMGYSDIGCFGGEMKTPNLDNLAHNGIRFTQFYGTAKCYPTRACLLTGLYFQQTDREFPGTATAGEVLRPAGYRTLWSGKHHANFNPVTRGFDRYFGMLGGACNFWNPGDAAIPGEPEPARKGNNAWAIDDQEFNPFIPDDPSFYTTDVFTDYALDWLDEYKDEDKPFFLYMAYNAPHWPLHAWPEDIAKYKGVYDGGYESIRQTRYQRQLDMGIFDSEIAPLSEPEWAETWNDLTPEEKQLESSLMEVYAAMTDRLDQNVGRLIKKLKELGKFEDTLIIFHSDNGASPETPNISLGDLTGPLGSVASFESIGKSWATVSNTPMRKWKTWSHEGGACTPMIAHWPKVIKGNDRINRYPCHLIDVLPTIVELTGAEYPEKINGSRIPPMQGISLTPAFKGKDMKRGKPLFWEFAKGNAIRIDNWKLVRKNSAWELFDMDVDRTETNDLAAQYPAKVQDMSAQWYAWYKDCTGEAYTL